MKDIFCTVVFACKLLGLIVFVSVLRPGRLEPAQPAMQSAYCDGERSGAQACGLSILASAPRADAGLCGIHRSSAAC
jgi:hypothetical protein